MFHVLNFYKMMSGHVRTSTVLSECAAFGYEQSLVQRIIGHFVKRGLLDSADSHGVERTPTHAKISESGKYYVNELAVDADYLTTALTDTDLAPPQIATTTGGIRYIERLRAIKTLVANICDEEVRLFGRINKQQSEGKVFARSLVEHGPLSSRLMNTLRISCEPRKSVKHGDVTSFNRALADLLLETEKLLSEKLKGIERSLALAKNAGIKTAPSDTNVRLIKIKNIGTVRFTYPAILSSHKPHRIGLTLQPLFKTALTRLVGLWMTEDPAFPHSKYFTLHRSNSAAPFRGEFALPPMPAEIKFPAKSDISLFDAAEEIAAFQLVS